MKDYYIKYNSYFNGSEQEKYDALHLPLNDYISKYYSKLDTYSEEVWAKWMNKYVNPAFSIYRQAELLKNLNFSSIKLYNYDKQNFFYNELINNKYLDDSLKKFIGFMAGIGFFDDNIQTLDDWLNSDYWRRPDLLDKYPEYKMEMTINQIVSEKGINGLNFLKSILPTLNFWDHVMLSVNMNNW